MREFTLPTEDNPELDREKLQHAILYFVQHPLIESLGAAKVMQLLYFADFDSYEQYEHPITGARYRKHAHGPVPDEAMAAIDELVRSGRVVRHEVMTDGMHRHRYASAEPIDLALLSEEEQAVLDRVAVRWAAATSPQIEAATRDEAPWIAVHDDEVIPYYLAHYRNNFDGMTLEADELADRAEVSEEDEVFSR